MPYSARKPTTFDNNEIFIFLIDFIVFFKTKGFMPTKSITSILLENFLPSIEFNTDNEASPKQTLLVHPLFFLLFHGLNLLSSLEQVSTPLYCTMIYVQ